MVFGQPPIVLPIKLLLESMLNRGSQGGPSLMLEHDRERAGCLRQPAALCYDRPAAARNSLHCDETERFLATGRDNDHSTAVQQFDERFPSPQSKEGHLTGQPKFFRHS